MWANVTKQISFTGKVEVAAGTSALALRGVLVDVYRAVKNGAGQVQFQRLNDVTARTSSPDGEFAFTNLPVQVQTQMMTPATPPFTPVEVVNQNTLPTLVFRVSVEAEVLAAGTTSQGNQFTDVYDERTVFNDQWLLDHPNRKRVPLTVSNLDVLIPEGDPEAMTIAGISSMPSTVPGRQFHFLRVGRATRDEIGEIGDSRPAFQQRTGYMRSATTSFFPGVVDAVFAGQLHIGGHFGATYPSNLYYTVRYHTYSGDPALPYDPALLSAGTVIEDPLFNKKYLLPHVMPPAGQWQSLNLGPFDGTVTDIEAGADPVPLGTTVKVYKRPPAPVTADEYWPFWDLLAIWNSSAAPNELIVLTLEAYEQDLGGSDTAPNLRKLMMDDTSPNIRLPLFIDNRPPALKLYDWRTGVAEFAGETVDDVALFDPCGTLPVTVGQVNSNECILVKYSVEDGAGNPHPHVGSYGLSIHYSPKQLTSSVTPTEATLPLRTFLSSGTYKPVGSNYVSNPLAPPTFEVSDFESVLVPDGGDDKWPPEPQGDGLSPCRQYALAVRIGANLRAVDGWSHVGHANLARYIIAAR